MGSTKYRYTPFYDDMAQYPGLAIFHRFSGPWAWILHDGTQEVLEKEKIVNDALAGIQAARGSATILTVTDCLRIHMEGNSDLNGKIRDYKDSIRNYSRDLYLSYKISKLPDPAQYYSNYLKQYQGLFDHGIFGPTGESAEVYQPNPSPDMCAWKTIPDADIFTSYIVDNSEWIEKHIWSRLRRFSKRGKQPHHTPERTYVWYDVIVAFMDTVTCIFVPLLLTVSMFALISIRSIKIRVAIVGVFGLLFSLSVKVMGGHPSRGEVFAATAAFYAVASVFVGTTSANTACN
ncbi:hypothetical protein K469DRAFT_103837 [Zopfia rhizophila CBS 207.26]|uniref:DUF6594 domain-containing protein n=1 Tax=Zopfia rhizophila CBS 207.26 TaxID=1314779 RepID=A0A6A6ECV5_9PEZI|nr:hypothetical protein K469DRAFT_103837 [Zopfia rhizophila CBS 207.26]